MTKTITIKNVDLTLLKTQQDRLSEVLAYLSAFSSISATNAEDWPEAIEGILNLLASIAQQD